MVAPSHSLRLAEQGERLDRKTDRQGADYLKPMYGPASYTVLDEVHKLPLKLADIYRRLTR
jgi:hypothetical protein